MANVFSSSDNLTENQSALVITDPIAICDIWNNHQRECCIRWICENGFKRVALQFPDNIISYSVQIASELQNLTDDSVRIYVLGDTSYGSCCVDEIAASHASADGIIHFGHACLSKAVRIPTFFVFFQYKMDAARLFNVLAEEFPDKNTRFTCFYDVGYLHAILVLKDELLELFPQARIATLTDPDQKPDVLCWKFDQPHSSDCPAIFLGKDNISFFNTSVAIESIQWYVYDPTSKHPALEKTNGIGAKWLRRRNYAIERCKDAGSIGIVVATLSIEGYLKIVLRIQQLAKARGVRTYLISIGKVNPEKLANFIDIDCFVLVGCPENDIFTSRDFFRPLLSVFEAEMALNPSRGTLYPNYTTNFSELLPEGRLYSNIEETLNIESDHVAPDVSLITGRARASARSSEKELISTEQKSLPVTKWRNELAHKSSADYFANRSWQGLKPNLGKDAPSVVQNGRSGIPIKYENDSHNV